jgi:hypothetical protein
MSGPVLVRRTKCCTLEYLEFFSSNTKEFWSVMLMTYIARAMRTECWLSGKACGCAASPPGFESQGDQIKTGCYLARIVSLLERSHLSNKV